MRIILAAAEVNPLAKTGGLADVAGSLSRAIKAAGHDIRVVLPAYKCVGPWKPQFVKRENCIKVLMGKEEVEGSVWEGVLDRLPVYLIEQEEYFNRDGLYGVPGGGDYPDNARRFAFFCHAVLKSLPMLPFRPEIIHCNDWHTALIPVLLRNRYFNDPFYRPIKTVYTIHNLGYQGQFDTAEGEALGIEPGLLEIHGRLNFMKGAIATADLLTTVSPTYAREIQTTELGFGLEGEIASRSDFLYGILNGIDTEEWNPQRDPYIPCNYDSSSFQEIKPANKASLQQELGLEVSNVPLLAVVSRLADQKGIDLLLEAFPVLLEQDLQVAVLGTGDKRVEQELGDLAERFSGRFALKLVFSDQLAHRIYAGADMLLVPSRYEPCGLTQMIGLRYGTVPLARATGGLVDTVIDVSDMDGRGNGFVFRDYSAEKLIQTCRRAVELYHQPEAWKELMKKGMGADFSWRNSALEYLALYYKVSVE